MLHAGTLGKILASSLSALCIGALLYSSVTYEILTFDPYWLLSMGREYLNNGNPDIDSFSYTYEGNFVAGNYEIFGAIFYFLTTVTSIKSAALIIRFSAAILIAIPIYKVYKEKSPANFFFITSICIIAISLQYRY